VQPINPRTPEILTDRVNTSKAKLIVKQLLLVGRKSILEQANPGLEGK
jgi:hypothetical protein